VFNWGVARINLYKIDKGMLELVHFFPAAGTIISALIILLTVLSPSVFRLAFTCRNNGITFNGSSWYIQVQRSAVFIYIPVIVPTQIWGYGLGFIIAFVKRILLGKGEFTGFVKKYYR
jgi:hypothetical protein